MTEISLFRYWGVMAAASWIILSGCLGKSQSPRFYALTPLQQDQVTAATNGAGRNAAVGIGPVKIADYLDQSKIVIRTGDNRLERAVYDQWVGSFKENLTHVMADNIGFLLPTEQIFIFPWRSVVVVEYQVMLDIIQCDGRMGEEVHLVARWRLLKGEDKTLLTVKRSSIKESVDSDDYTAIVIAQSRALAQLSREIAEAIHAFSRQ